VRYSLLAMIHAIVEGLFDTAQMRAHLRVIEEHLTGPDGARLFDRPLPYRGGLQRHFQRAESASYFGREIGLMYMHAHLRYAQALAHVGESERFFHALCQANPIGLRALVPNAAPRPSNAYYSSSDAAFADRYQASAEYERVRDGTIQLEGGWRVYSSGAGILSSLVVRHLFGLRLEADALLIDPVMPAALDGLRVRFMLLQRAIEITYDIKGPGCGVNALLLNNRPLAFDEEPQPYRRGAARVKLQHLGLDLDAERPRQLVIRVGA
jgi:cellobiose phosphorylase